MHYSINPSFQYSSLCCYSGLNRFFFILSSLIFDSSVDEGIPSLAAAPQRPAILPLLSASEVSMIFFSCSCSFSARVDEFPFGGTGAVDNQLGSTENTSLSPTIIDLSITFCSSRMLPGQE